MRELRYTLVTNGSSDTALLPILTWLLRTNGVSCAIQPEWADLGAPPPAVCVVPVRMQEAWLLFDEAAIRYAAGNPSGRQPLDLPAIRQIEQLADPKAVLHECLRQASGLNGRRLRWFRARSSVHRITGVIDDFSPLRALPAFAALENDVRETIRQRGWDAP